MSGLLDFLKRAASGVQQGVANIDRRVQSGLPDGTMQVGMPSYIGGPKALGSGMKTLYGAMKPGAAAARLAEQRAFPAMARAERTAPLFEANAANGMAVQAGQRMSPLAGSPIPGAAPTSLREAFLAAMKEGR